MLLGMIGAGGAMVGMGEQSGTCRLQLDLLLGNLHGTGLGPLHVGDSFVACFVCL